MVGSRLLSIRWWLPLTFALIAAVTATAVAQVFRAQSQEALRGRAQDLAAGIAVGAAARIGSEPTVEAAQARTVEQAQRRRVALFLFDENGHLVSPGSSQGVDYESVEDGSELVDSALAGQRVVESLEDGRRIVVALPIRRGAGRALVEVAARPDLVAAASIVRDRIWVAAAWATLVGAFCGILVSMVITARVRRIGAAADAIAGGEFAGELKPRFPDELGGLAQAVDVMRQNLKASFDDLAGERDQLRSLIEQLHEGVIGIRDDLTVVVANARASVLLGDEVSEGRTLPSPWPAHDLLTLARRLFVDRAETETLRVVQSQERTYLVTGIPAAGARTAVLVVTDVTEQERRERAEREFVANAAHELRTPVAAIASAVEVLQQGAKYLPEELERFLDLIERQASRLGRLDRALLVLARAQTRDEPLSLTRIDVPQLLEAIVEDMDLDAGVLDTGDAVFALAHEDLVRQAIENLISNARRYAAGAELIVSARVDGGDNVVVEVRDRGPGMSPAQAERVVERFFRAGDRNSEGFGLGLSIAREVARAVGGRLEIETQEGKGTTARLILRQAPPPPVRSGPSWQTLT